MKKPIALVIACLILASIAFATQPSAADQKWLQVVEKKIAAGQTQVSTPAPERVSLLQEWATKNGYSVQVTKTETSYRVELLKSIAQK